MGNDLNGRVITHLLTDREKFRVPSLRNIEASMPFMHNGRFFSLEEALAHYHSGFKDFENADPEFRKGEAPGIPLSKNEQQQLITFLKTLTDFKFNHDKSFEEE